MARKAQPAAESKAVDLPTTSPAIIHEEQQFISRHEAELAQVTDEFGLGVPYNLETYIAAARNAATIAALQTFELGRLLLVIKAHSAHGEFLPALERIGVTTSTAARCMTIARKFEGTEGKKLLAAKLSAGKLLELSVVDNEVLESVAEGGTIAGHTLDDIDRMSISDLRKALREEKQGRVEDKETHDAILARKDKKINDLASKNRSQGKLPLRSKVEDRLAEIAELAMAHLSSGDTLRQALLDLNELVEDSGETMDADLADQITGHVTSIRTMTDNLADIAGI